MNLSRNGNPIFASLSHAQEDGDFQPSSTNVWAAEYPRVESAGRMQIRVKAPDATKVRLNFWSGPKLDMENQQDGFWTVTPRAFPVESNFANRIDCDFRPGLECWPLETPTAPRFLNSSRPGEVSGCYKPTVCF